MLGTSAGTVLIDLRVAYTRWADSYDSDRNPTRDLDRAITADILGSRRLGTVIEAGCGTGKNTGLLAEIGHGVLALDFSEGMLARARERVRMPNVCFCRTDLSSGWPCAAGSADLVTCNLVLEHLEDLEHFFLEAARVLTPGGVLFVSELHPYRQYQGGRARFEIEGVALEIQAYVHHVSDFLRAASAAELWLERLDEWWHAEDESKPPRLISFLWSRRSSFQAD